MESREHGREEVMDDVPTGSRLCMFIHRILTLPFKPHMTLIILLENN